MSIDMDNFLKMFKMRKMRKIVNIAVIFMIMERSVTEIAQYDAFIPETVPPYQKGYGVWASRQQRRIDKKWPVPIKSKARLNMSSRDSL